MSDSDSDSSVLLERNGPKYGISFTRAQADVLIRQHLNETITSFESIESGYNNLIFLIDTAESAQRYVLKIGGRYWIRIKTEAEVKALELLTQHTTIPAPRVLAYSSDRGNEFGVEWILMTRLPGENLAAVCEKHPLSQQAKISIIRDLADCVAQMHFKVPRFEQIGALTGSGEIGTDLNGLGPWSTYDEFIRTRVLSEVSTLKTTAVFDPIKDSMLAAIDEFLNLPLPSFAHLLLVFSHGDLDSQNILVSMDDPESPHITGVVDWEWAGSFPCSEEYFTSYNYFVEDSDAEIRRAFLDELEQRHVLTPRTIERFSLLEKINQFVTSLAPWDLTDLIDPDDAVVSRKLEKSRSVVQTALAGIRNELSGTAVTE